MILRKIAAALLGTALPLSPAAAATAAATAPVPYYHQQLSNDCEAAALRMVLASRGHHVSDAQVLARIGVDLAHPFYGFSGPHSGDPFRAFVGDPDGSELGGSGYGVFAPPVAAAARSYGVTVLAAGQGIGLDRLRSLVNAGHPAVVWADYLWRDLASHPYTAYDGRRVPYAGPAEHALTLLHIGRSHVELNDPARSHYWLRTSEFTAGYATYGQMAVVVA